ncbi:MAG: hypothetical protein EAZ95_05875 [Bacteroidetes bacterium]|nr:MAG: hypothetical protein EAZ95_05875 [Bacteroidota bacterium]
MKTRFSHIAYAMLMTGLVACGGEKPADKPKVDEKEAQEVKENLEKVLTDVPKPSELPYQIQKTGAPFDEKIPNAPANVEKYKTTNFKAALNLGVYACDIGYVAVHKKVQNAIDYINAATQLGDKLSLSSSLDAKVKERFEKNIKDTDSLTAIINEAIGKSDKYLKDNDQAENAALVFAGIFTEGLYIATQIVDSYPDDELPKDIKNQILVDMVQIITKQDKPLNDLIKALKTLKKSDDVGKLITQLEDLAGVYKKLDIDKKVKENRGDLILTDETIKGITAKVKEIRASIVG